MEFPENFLKKIDGSRRDLIALKGFPVEFQKKLLKKFQ